MCCFHRSGALLACLLLGTVVAPLSADEPPRKRGHRLGLNYPGRTDAGSWEGTWFYINRSERWTLWIREDGDGPKLKLRYSNTDKAESFTTDWSGSVEYVHRSRTGAFSLATTEADENVIRADWSWRLGTPGSAPDSGARVETAKLLIYRGGAGRQLVMRFDDFEREYRLGEKQYRIDSEVSWTFRKSSRRLVRWDELPF